MNASPSILIAAAAEVALNGYLAMDPEVAARLSKLEGKVLAMEILGLGTSLYLIPASDRLQVVDHFEGDPDVTLRGSPLAFAQLTGGDTLGAQVELRGDTTLGQQFQSVLQDVEIDWEEILSGVTGDVLAHQIGNLVRGLGRWGAQLSETLVQNTSEYLQEERRELPPPVSVSGFSDDVDTLRADVDRLEARVTRLATRITQGSRQQ